MSGLKHIVRRAYGAIDAFRHESGRVRLAISALSVVISLSPFAVLSGGSALHDWLSNRAMAAAEASGNIDVDPSRQAKIVRSSIRETSDAIIGLEGSDVLMAFSFPELKRMEGPMRIWQYRGDDCVMDIYLKDGGANDAGSASVIHYEVRTRDKAVLRPEMKIQGRVADKNECTQAIMDGAERLRGDKLASAQDALNNAK